MGLKGLTGEILQRTQLKFRLSRWEALSKSSKRVTIPTKQGVFTVSSEDQVIGKTLYCYREFEFDLISKVMNFLRSRPNFPQKGQGTLVDIGANNGVISVAMLNMGEVEKAIAIEPEPQNFSLLENNVKQNGLSNRIICLQYAVSEKKGELSFELSKDNFGDHRVRAGSQTNANELFCESNRRVITVNSDRLDAILANVPDTFSRNVSLIWIDVQGYEGYAFMGARDILSKGVPVASEIWPYGIRRAGMSKERFCEIVKSIWSSFWVMRRGRFVQYPIAIFDFFFDELGYDGEFDNIIFTL
jgi:FkbM family methyltransferase